MTRIEQYWKGYEPHYEPLSPFPTFFNCSRPCSILFIFDGWHPPISTNRDLKAAVQLLVVLVILIVSAVSRPRCLFSRSCFTKATLVEFPRFLVKTRHVCSSNVLRSSKIIQNHPKSSKIIQIQKKDVAFPWLFLVSPPYFWLPSTPAPKEQPRHLAPWWPMAWPRAMASWHLGTSRGMPKSQELPSGNLT